MTSTWHTHNYVIDHQFSTNNMSVANGRPGYVSRLRFFVIKNLFVARTSVKNWINSLPFFVGYRDRGLRRLREDLRAEEMKLVLLKKLKQSQQLKENVAVLPPSIPQSALPPTGLPSGLSITPTTVKVPSNKSQPPQVLHSRHPNSHKAGQGSVPSLLRGVSNIVFFVETKNRIFLRCAMECF